MRSEIPSGFPSYGIVDHMPSSLGGSRELGDTTCKVGISCLLYGLRDARLVMLIPKGLVRMEVRVWEGGEESAACGSTGGRTCYVL